MRELEIKVRELLTANPRFAQARLAVDAGQVVDVLLKDLFDVTINGNTVTLPDESGYMKVISDCIRDGIGQGSRIVPCQFDVDHFNGTFPENRFLTGAVMFVLWYLHIRGMRENKIPWRTYLSQLPNNPGAGVPTTVTPALRDEDLTHRQIVVPQED